MPWSIPTRLRLFLGVLCWVCSNRRWTPAEAAILNFTLEPKSSVLVERNRAFTIECSANGVPKPKVYWWKDGAVLVPSEDVRFTQKRLYFRAGVRESHLGSPRVGVLRCMARNSAGVLMGTKIALEIIYLRNITLTLQPPVVGNIARLECKLSSNQPVNITWLKDNQTINSALDTRITVLPFGVLQIKDFRSSDNGNYSCRAENKYEGIASLPLQVVKQVRAGTQLQIYPGKAVNVKVGGQLVLECLDSGPTSNLTWSKFTQTEISVLASGVNFANFVINPVRVSDGGEYFCQGATGVREKIVVSVRVPPTFTTPLPSTTKLNNGDKLTVECEPTGNPTPSLVWFREGRRLVESGRVRFVRENTVYKLVVNNVTLADGGVYQCEAENELGSSIQHTILDVAGEIGPPTNVRANVLSATVVNVTWNPPSGYTGQSAYYSVHYSDVIERTELQAITKDRATFQTIEYLKPYTEYLIYVKVFYSSKPTRRSKMVTVRTKDEVPTGPPLHVHLKSYTYGTLDIIWLPPKLDERNGHVTGYNISITYEKPEGQTRFITVVKNFYSFTVKNLVEGRKYFVTIAAGTRIGWGPFSEELSCIVTRKSPVGVILAAPEISAKLVNSSIVVSVKPPVNWNVMGYNLTYWNMRNNDVQYRRKVDISTRTFEYTLQNLKVNSEYAIIVTANGTGTTLSRPAIAVVASKKELPNPDNTTMPDAPTMIFPPMGFTCHHAQLSTALVLKWQRPPFQIRATEYRIKYFVTSNEKTSKFIPTKLLNFTLTGLLPGTAYDVEIQSKRDGFFSSPVKPESGKCILPEKKPETAPRDFTCTVNVDKIVMNWRAPEKPNGKIIEYRINWRDSTNKTRWTKYKSLGFLSHYSATLENVRKDLCFVVSVDAVNSAGISPRAKCSIDTTKICQVLTTQTPNGSKDLSSFKYDDIKLGIIIGCVISLLFVIFLILFVLWSDPCRCRRHKPLREVEVETSLGTDNHPRNRLSKPDTNSTEVSEVSSKHYQIFQKYFPEEASKESDRGLGMTPKNSHLCLDNEKTPFLQKTQHQDYSNGASFDSQDSGIQGLDKLEKGSSSSSSSSSSTTTKDAQKRPPQSNCVVLETVC